MNIKQSISAWIKKLRSKRSGVQPKKAVVRDAAGNPERRRGQRLNILVTYFLIGEDKQREASITKNISTYGLCIISDKDLKPDNFVSLEIDLYDDQPSIHAKGKIVWMREVGISTGSGKMDYELGIEFIEITDDARRRVLHYVSAHDSQKGQF